MPWNKGKKLSLETRLRMSLAKKGTTHCNSAKRKMSRAANKRLTPAPVGLHCPHCSPP